MSDDPNSSGTRSGDSTSTVPTDDSPEPPKRGCRKRGCLLGCPGLIVLFWLIAASAWFSFFRFVSFLGSNNPYSASTSSASSATAPVSSE